MIIKIRHIDDADPVYFTEIPGLVCPGDVIDFLSAHGGISYNYEPATDEFRYQFIVADGEAFLEILLDT